MEASTGCRRVIYEASSKKTLIENRTLRLLSYVASLAFRKRHGSWSGSLLSRKEENLIEMRSILGTSVDHAEAPV